MDRKSSQPRQIEELIQISSAARSVLATEAHALKQKLDVPARVRSSLKEHPASWILGGLGSGIVASMFLRRRSAPAPEKKRSLPIAILGLTLTAARPLLKVWLGNQLKGYLSSRLGAAQPSSSHPFPPPSNSI